MSFNKPIILLASVLLLLSCRQGKVKSSAEKPSTGTNSEVSGTFNISGAFALYPLVQKWSNDFMKLHPGVKTNLSIVGTGEGLEDLRSKKSQLSMISRPLSDTELGEGIWTVPVAKDGVAPIVNKKNPYLVKILSQGLSPDKLLKVFTSDKPLTWGELLDATSKEKVPVYIRKDESGASDVFAAFLNKESSDLKGTGVTGDIEMIKSIQNNPLAIGFCNFSYAFDLSTGNQVENIQIIPVDLNYNKKIDTKEIPFNNLDKAHRGLWLGIYPKNLCRELTFGSLGKPTDPAVVEFLKYVLTSGQEDVKTSGLCELNDVYVSNSLDKLK
jgi:phosphate transport system substrate-binding protein